MEWFYSKDGEKIGPISKEDIRVLVKNNIIIPSTMIWCSDKNEWKAYDIVKDEIENYQEPENEYIGEIKESIAEEEMQVCNECFKTFPENEMIQIGDKYICAECKPKYLQRIREGIAVTSGMYVGFGKRFIAKIIDGIIMSMVMGLIAFLFSLMMGPLINMQTGRLGATYFAMLGASFILQIAYYVYFVGTFQATIGKMILGIQITMADGSAVSYVKALERYAAEMLSGMIFYIGYLMVLFDEQKRALHDRICNTRVVYR